ncbi:glycosyltransferase [Mesorhizobium sp. ZMM04-5]|uniref:Glycosyltransferase n=1 Tax=Mesorhizobium marinum TaxID=3228790 RepID=A0ABV3R1E6_9HYPH
MTRPPPTIALFPEASFGAALNCIGIAQALRERGARPAFICHPGFTGLFADYGFPEHHLPAAAAKGGSPDTWQGFVDRHLPHFNLPPLEQLETYVGPTWEAIVDTAIGAEAGLRRLLARLKPDAVVLDNVIMFPALAGSNVPWVRMISCAETELPDPEVPPYLSGLSADDPSRADFESRYLEAVAPAHDRFNRFRAGAGLPALPAGTFLETSPWLNLLLTPGIVRRDRADPLDPERFVYLEGCVRREGPFDLPDFPRAEGPLVYLGFGSLGAGDTDLIERMIAVFATLPARFIVNVGGFRDAYRAVPDNVYLDAWFPQPSVVEQCDLFIHHGGNNSFCEALYFGVPSLIMPYCWDGHDNARRAVETGVGRRLDRASWTADDLASCITALLGDETMRRRLSDNAAAMAARPGTAVAADAILDLLG